LLRASTKTCRRLVNAKFNPLRGYDFSPLIFLFSFRDKGTISGEIRAKAGSPRDRRRSIARPVATPVDDQPVPTATGSALPVPSPPPSPGGTDTRSNRGPHLRRRPVARREFTVTGYNGTIRRHHGRTRVAVHGRRVELGQVMPRYTFGPPYTASLLFFLSCVPSRSHSLSRALSLSLFLALAAASLAPAGSEEPGARSRPPSSEPANRRKEGRG